MLNQDPRLYAALVDVNTGGGLEGGLLSKGEVFKHPNIYLKVLDEIVV